MLIPHPGVETVGQLPQSVRHLLLDATARLFTNEAVHNCATPPIHSAYVAGLHRDQEAPPALHTSLDVQKQSRQILLFRLIPSSSRLRRRARRLSQRLQEAKPLQRRQPQARGFLPVPLSSAVSTTDAVLYVVPDGDLSISNESPQETSKPVVTTKPTAKTRKHDKRKTHKDARKKHAKNSK
jgi:hypothetical protein